MNGNSPASCSLGKLSQIKDRDRKDDPKRGRTSSKKSSNRDTSGDDEESSTLEEENYEEEDIDLPREETCSLCHRRSRSLLHCSYPDCPCSYHSVCVSPTLSVSILTTQNQPSPMFWICPRHYCTMCGKLDTSPAYFLAYPDIYPISKEPHRYCITCPFSLCQECLTQHDDIFHSLQCQDPWNVSPSQHGSNALIIRDQKMTRKAQYMDKKSYQLHDICMNCTDHDRFGTLLLAKFLEQLWCMIGTSYLALPFLAPLLPGCSIELEKDNRKDDPNLLQQEDLPTEEEKTIPPDSAVVEASSTTPAATTTTTTPQNLMDVLTRVRQLYYCSMEEFVEDLKIVRQRLVQMLEAYYEEVTVICTDVEHHALVQAYDTLISPIINMNWDRKQSILINVSRERYHPHIGTIMLPVLDTKPHQQKLLGRMKTQKYMKELITNPMVLLWRKECIRLPHHLSKEMYMIPGRSLVAWNQYVSQWHHEMFEEYLYPSDVEDEQRWTRDGKKTKSYQDMKQPRTYSEVNITSQDHDRNESDVNQVRVNSSLSFVRPNIFLD